MGWLGLASQASSFIAHGSTRMLKYIVNTSVTYVMHICTSFSCISIKNVFFSKAKKKNMKVCQFFSDWNHLNAHHVVIMIPELVRRNFPGGLQGSAVCEQARLNPAVWFRPPRRVYHVNPMPGYWQPCLAGDSTLHTPAKRPGAGLESHA